jgi:tripartite-type tricarboxylate transporter receptor subunit TctC
VAHAAPDGYTIGLATSSTHSIAPLLTPHLGYDPTKDFAPVSLLGSSPYVLVTAPNLKVKSVSELISLAKMKPHELNYASAGPASLAHIAGALFARRAGVELTEVPYRSSAQSVLDLSEGRIQLQFGTIGPTLGLIRAGKVHALAVTGAKRNALLPAVPTLQESGLAGYDVVLWMAMVAPTGVPKPIISRLNLAVATALHSTEVSTALKAQGIDPEPSSPEALTARIRAEMNDWRSLAQPALANSK